MTLNIELSPQTSARLSAFARQKGVDPQTLVTTLVEDNLPPIKTQSEQELTIHSVDPANDASIALLQSWIAQAPTDPEGIREAEEDLLEFKRNMNANRATTGERLPYPEAK